MPSGGALSNPNDKALVTSLEDKMIEAYGTALVEVKCKAAGGKKVDLQYKMLRPVHVGALFAAVERYQVAELDLTFNQLGAAGGALVAAALKTNTTLTTLKCAQLGRPSNQVPRVGILVRPHRHATLAALALFTFLCRVRSLDGNKLDPVAGMALAEALKGNTTLTSLKSAALPSNPLARASRPQQHARSLHPPFSPSFAVCAASSATNSAPRVAWRSPRSSRATRPSRRSSLLPCRRTHSPMRPQGP
eukprot:scaffold78295_cov57-Phaeocystis_antarctica.AAC.1